MVRILSPGSTIDNKDRANVVLPVEVPPEIRMLMRTLGDGSAYGVKIQYVEQEETLGIAHAVSRLEPYVDRPFFLFLGDIFFDTENLPSMVDRFCGGHGLGGLLACKREPDLEAIKRNFVVLTGPDGLVQLH